MEIWKVWPMMISLRDISSSFIFPRHMGRWKKKTRQTGLGWWRMKSFCHRQSLSYWDDWYSRVLLAFSAYCIVHQYAFPRLLPFRNVIQRKTSPISGQAPLCALWHHLWWCSEEGLFRRRILVFCRHMKTGTYLALDFDLNFYCRALWHSFRLEDLPIRVGSVMMRKRKVVSHLVCLFFVLLNLSASFWSTLNVAKQWDAGFRLCFACTRPWKSQH